MNVSVTDPSIAPQLYDLLDEFITLLRSNKGVPVHKFAEQHPEFKDQILADFPALLIAEGLKIGASSAGGSSAAESPAKHPEYVAGYRVQSVIGQGGMGIVYRAAHPKLSRELAVKVLLSRRDKPQYSERFRREAESASKLNHPNIVPVFDFGEQDGTQYLVMPLVEGTSLDHILNNHRDRSQASGGTQSGTGIDTSAGKGATSSSTADSSHAAADCPIGRNADFSALARIGAGVASALAHAHQHNIIHRDIKPGNLILSNTGKVWVTDFGLAKILDVDSDLSQTGDVIGTPRFMAPEQMRGLYDERSDIYSLGVTLYELVSGTRAWDAVSASQLLKTRATAELPELSETAPWVPRPLADVIMNACAFRPEDRYRSATELQVVLNRFAHGEKTGDRRRRNSRTSGSSWQRKRTVAGLVLLIPLLSLLTMYAFSVGPWGDSKVTEETLITLVQDETQREKIVEELPDIIEAAITSQDENVREQASDLTLKVVEEALLKSTANASDKEKLMSTVTEATNEFRKKGFQYDPMNHPLTNAVRNLDLARQVSGLKLKGATKLSLQFKVAAVGELIRRKLVTNQQVNELLSYLPENARGRATLETPPQIESETLVAFLHHLNRVFAEAKAKVESDVKLQQAFHGATGATGTSGRRVQIKLPENFKLNDELKQKIRKAIGK